MSKALASSPIKLAELKTMMSSTSLLKRYVETITPYMSADPQALVGILEIREEQGQPILRFVPELKLINILRPKLEDRKGTDLA